MGHAVFNYSIKFYEAFNIYPNLLLAAETTWKKIDHYANLISPVNIYKGPETDDEMNEEFKSISSFVTPDFELEFCLDFKIKENYFILIFDEDPSFDGEPVEDPQQIVYRRIAWGYF